MRQGLLTLFFCISCLPILADVEISTAETGTLTTNEYGQLYYVSDQYVLTDRSIRLTVLEPSDSDPFENWDGVHPFMSLAEFYLWDEDGQKIELEPNDFSTNAQEPVEGPIGNICDDNRNTFFHTLWTERIDEYHYFEIALPDSVNTEYVTFGMLSRNGYNYQMPKRFIMSGIDFVGGELTVQLDKNDLTSLNNCKLEIQNCINGQKLSITLTGKDSYTFKGLCVGNTYNVSIRNNYGDVIASKEKVEVKRATVIKITDFVTLADVRIKVTADGADVTDEIAVKWFDKYGYYRSQTNVLKCQPVGSLLKFDAILNERLGSAYVQPDMYEYTVLADNNLIELSLHQLQMMDHSCIVRDHNNNPIANARVTVSQKVNDKYTRTCSVETNAEGLSNIHYVMNSVAELTISANGYLSQNVAVSFEDDNLPEEIILKPIVGTTKKIVLSFKESVAEGEEATVLNAYEDYSNISFSVFNKTENKEFTDFVVQFPIIIFMEDFNQDDELLITASSKKNSFLPITATINSDDYIQLEIVELGGIKATYEYGSGNEITSLLYDANGNLAASADFKNKSVKYKNLQDGEYRMIVMEKSDYFSGISRFAQLGTIGLKEGEHFLSTTVNVRSGAIEEVSYSNIPAFDQSLLYYTCSPTSFTTNKQMADFASYVTLQSQIKFKKAHESTISDVALLVDIPKSCQFIENSAIQNGQTLPYNIDDNGQLNIPLHDYENIVKMCITPLDGGTHHLSAYVRFCDKGKTFVQPIGQASVIVKDLTFNVSPVLTESIFKASGNARAASDVKVYDNDVLIGQTTANSNGRWSMKCELYKPYIFSRHSIYAKYTLTNGNEISTTKETVLFDSSSPHVTTVKMINTAHYGSDISKVYESSCIFDFKNKSISTNSYRYWPLYPTFSFIIDIERNENVRINDVYLKIFTSDNKYSSHLAEYNSEIDSWIVKANFQSSKSLPVNVAVDIDYTDNYPHDFSPLLINDMELLQAHSDDLISKTKGELCDDEENKSVYNFSSSGDEDRNLSFSISQVDYSLVRNASDPDFEYFEYTLPSGRLFKAQIDVNDTEERIILINEDEEIAIECKAIPTLDDRQKATINRNVPYWATQEGTNIQFVTGQDGALMLVPGGIVDSDIRVPEFEWLVNMLKDDFNLVFTNEDAIVGLINDQLEGIYNAQQKVQKIYTHKCNDGDYSLSSEQKEHYAKRITDLADATYNFANSEISYYHTYLMKKKAYSTMRLYFAVLEGIVGIGIKSKGGPAIDKVGKLLEKKGIINTINLFGDIPNKVFAKYFDDKLRDLVSKTLKDLGDSIVSKCYIYQANDDFMKERDRFESQMPAYSEVIYLEYRALLDELRDNARCLPIDEETPSSDFTCPNLTVIQDPSGYVYEGVVSNRLEGVTATCFYKEEIEDMYGEKHEKIDVWNADEFGQVNPQKTDADGLYAWDVPQGLWQVKFEKEGYETTYSEWLPVPPPQLDVNIAMRQMIHTEVKNVKAHADGVSVEFSKYVKAESLNESTMNLINAYTGDSIPATIHFVNLDSIHDSHLLTKAKLIPAEPLCIGDSIYLFISEDIENYVGLGMAEDYKKILTVDTSIKGMEADSILEVAIGREKELNITVYPAEAAVGKILKFQSYSPSIAEIDEESTVIDENGHASVTVRGCLSGSSVISFLIPDIDMEGATVVNVLDNSIFKTARPVASILSECYVDKGQSVELSCSTEGARIFYTLDGSCPCESTAFLYTEPIVIEEETTIKAMATANDMEDSEIVTFHYFINDSNVIPVEEADDIAVYGGDKHITIEGAYGRRLSVYNISGLAFVDNYRIHANNFTLNVPKGLYFVLIENTFHGGYKILVK